jgi:cyclic beta-1,2-glucan synthetase
VLDPIFSLRCRVRLAGGASARLTFSTVVSSSREAVLDLADKVPRSGDLRARGHARVDPRAGGAAHLGVEAQRGPPVPSASRTAILYCDPSLRASPDVLRRNTRGQSGLWALRHLRRPADRARRGSTRRRSGDRAPAAPRARVLADGSSSPSTS